MTTVKRVQSKIFRIEGFAVKILHGRDFRDVRDDRHGLRAYRFKNAASASMSVGAWERRFRQDYPGFAVEILTGKGKRADGRMHLATVRRSYGS
jgi:hypothetical protein